MSDTRPELTVRQQLVQLKDDGNAAYKAGEFAAAFKQYTAALAKAQQEGLVDLDAERSGDSAVQLVATLYANRAAVGLKLLRYEQVIHDSSHALSLVLAKGCSDSEPRMGLEMKGVYGKACMRRGAAWEALGNCMQAQVDYMRTEPPPSLSEPRVERMGGPQSEAKRRWGLMAECLTCPVRWGAYVADLGLSIPPFPVRRSSAMVDTVVKQAKCKVPQACLFMSCVTWQGRIYVWGGGRPDPINPRQSAKLVILDPAKGSATPVEVQPDPDSQRRFGLPGHPAGRYRHTAVQWQGSMFVYGGDCVDGSHNSADKDEARTVWRLDLTAEPLTWQRIFCKGHCPEGRHNHTASLWSDQMIICGGENPRGGRHLGDVWAFDLVHLTWRELVGNPQPRRISVPAQAPEPRREHAAWVHGDWLYVFGGMSTSVQSTTEAVQQEYIISAFTFPSMWRFSLTERRWEPVHYGGNSPAPLGEMGVAVSPKGTIYVAGGYTTAAYTAMRPGGFRSLLRSAYSAEVFEFSCTNHYWRRLVTSDMQPALGDLRGGSSACWLDNQLYVMGGYYCLSSAPVIQRSVLAIDVRTCAHCGVHREHTPNRKLQQCSRCKDQGRAAVYYCSEACLQQDWATHKIVCNGERGILP